MWRTSLLYNLLSDYEILRIRLVVFFDFVSCGCYRGRQIPWFRPQPYNTLEKDEFRSSMGALGTGWKYMKQHFFDEQIQKNIKPLAKTSN